MEGAGVAQVGCDQRRSDYALQRLPSKQHVIFVNYCQADLSCSQHNCEHENPLASHML